ncbi:hypothetical protein BDV33DRAFT_187008 [Aspergillus novoparasiticus]|uniref:Uncharacterized protein n=1 Tax=Aspergillus novoparasiticus TaxID=986946 RepID=A0A5N6FAT8_9EURO|nr:hypothetical protein BDV33DRAFT_187008 [Aspergillus novoparasiticus]
MSVTVRSEIVDLDGLIPRPVDNDREDLDVARLTPWIFRQTGVELVEDDCTMDWPQEEMNFRDLFFYLSSYYYEVYEREVGITNALKACESISLPMRNWKQPEREYSRSFIRTQGLMLNMMMHTIYNNLDGIQGAAIMRLQEGLVPIISYTGWFEGMTWDKFPMETLSIMLGQLAKNTSIRTGNLVVQDQEVYMVGFYGRYIHIARGLFPADTIARVHSQGCSKDEAFDLKFTRGYDLCLKKDWLEATHALTRLYRYLRSGNTKASAVQAYLQRAITTGNNVP